MRIRKLSINSEIKCLIRSQQTWAAAAQAGHFADEIGPVTLKTRKGEAEFALDEHPKPKTTIEQLAKLPTVFKKGGVNRSGACRS